MKTLVKIFEVVAVVATAVFVIALFAYEPADPNAVTDETIESAEGDPQLVLGQDVYGRRCAGCHGGNGQGSVGPRLGGGAAEANFPDPADQAAVIVNGRGGMPGFSNLSDEEVDAVVVYTRQLPG